MPRKPTDDTTPDEAPQDAPAPVEEPVDLLATSAEHVPGLPAEDEGAETVEHVSGIAVGDTPPDTEAQSSDEADRSDRRPPLVEVAQARYDRSRERMTNEETR